MLLISRLCITWVHIFKQCNNSINKRIVNKTHIRPLHINNCLVQLSYQIWPQKTMEGSTDCWANHWYNPPYSPRTVLIQSEQKGWQNHSGPLTSSTLPLWTTAVWSTLQSSEHQNDQTQEQFLPPSNPSHEHLTWNVEHTTLLYNYLFTTHKYINLYLLIFSFQICTSDLYCIVFLLFCTLPICILFFCCLCSCGSVVEHCVSSAKGHGFNSQGTHILRKK